MSFLLSRSSSSWSLCPVRFLSWFKRSTDTPIASPRTSCVAENFRPAPDNADTDHPSDFISSNPPLSLTAPPATSTLPLANDHLDTSCPLATIPHNQEYAALSPHSPEGSDPPPPYCEVPASNFHAGAPLGIHPASVNGRSAPTLDPLQYGANSESSLGNIVRQRIESVTNIRVGGNYHEINIYSSPDDNTATTPVLPEILYRPIQNDSQRLLPILGVAIVFHDPPSILQISRVLGLDWTEVRDALRPISKQLALARPDSPIGFSSNVKLPSYLRDFLLERTGNLWIDPETCHSILARWCLTGQQTFDPRDIIYRGEFWAYHTCYSNPSAQLYDALRTSWIPLDPVSHTKLADVIVWLERQSEGQRPEDLISIYRQHQSQQPEPVPLMGGMISSMSF
ncbi:hypothetical protein DFH09DRAFT_1375346 [Mycena vulgaris]|nr:hypothetical protein DFH09DRAFT_1375346 [Mycena vulgaris]